MTDEQERALSDAALLRLFNSDDDLSILSASERQRLLKLTETPPPETPKPTVQPVSSHPPQGRDPWADALAMDPNYLSTDTANEMGRNLIQNLPAAGGMAGPLLGSSLVVGSGPFAPLTAAALAALGGYTGSRLRGDEHEDAKWEGGMQGLTQVAGMGGQAGLRGAASGTMKGAIPRPIRADFGRGRQVNIGREMLDRGAFPGFQSSEDRISRLSHLANVERDAAASTVPRMNAVKTIEGLRPLYQKAKQSGFPDDAAKILAEAQKSVRDIQQIPGTYGRGIEGPQQLGRKDIFQDRSAAALKGSEALPGQIADAQRDALATHLRESSPRMGRAMSESQKLMAVDKAMQAASYDNPFTRARLGGIQGASLTPMGLGVTAHGINQASRLVDPNVLRLLNSLMQQRSNEQE